MVARRPRPSGSAFRFWAACRSPWTCVRHRMLASRWWPSIRMAHRRRSIALLPRRFSPASTNVKAQAQAPRSCLTNDLASSDRFCFLGSAADLRVEVGEELRGKFLGGRLDQAAAKLGHLATDISLGRVGEDGRVGAIFLEADIRAAFGKACDTALSLT